MINLDGLSRKQLLKLFAIIAMSDGYVHNSRYDRWTKYNIRLETAVSSIGQHELFLKLCELLFNRRPIYKKIFNKYLSKYILQSHLYMTSAVKELFKLSPCFKTSARYNEHAEDFLAQPQPTISFLFNEPSNVKWLALSIYFDFDGSISPCFKLKNKKDNKQGKIYQYHQVQFEVEIRIAETNPSLVNELSYLCSTLGLKARAIKSKLKWSGYEGISISEFNSVRRFLKYCPSATDVRISGKSKRFEGLTKQRISDAVSYIFDMDIPLSYSFKDRNSALKCKGLLSNLLRENVYSPVV